MRSPAEKAIDGTPNLESDMDKLIVPLDDLPEESRQVLQQALQEDEVVQYVAKPLYLKSNGPTIALFIAAAIGVLTLVIVDVKSFVANGLMFGVALLVLMGIIIYTFVSHGRKFVAITSKKIIIRPGMGTLTLIRFETIVSVIIEKNPLQCRDELAIRRKMPRGKRPKVDYIDSMRDLGYIEAKIRENWVAAVPSAPAGASSTPPAANIIV